MDRNLSTLCAVTLLLCVILANQVQLTLAPFVHARAVADRVEGSPDTTAQKIESPRKPAVHKPRATAGSSIPVTVTVVNLITGDDPVLPNAFYLDQNFPNPFNASTVVKYGVSLETPVLIEVFNVLGQRVAVLAEGVHSPGHYQATWDPSQRASGVYFYRMIAGEFRKSRHMIQLK
jgi:hypothetical protein